jgi:uncharacterized protein (DUF427 family)/glutaredoxin
MEQPADSAAGIEVLWRPGCPYCSRLRRGLRRAGVATVERNIWADPAAAARVRAVTGGDETVPTVVVGGLALVNPSVNDVLAAVRAEHGGDPAAVREELQSAPPAPAGAGAAAVWTLAATALWMLLAAWRPTTTWHLGPVLAAAAAPWLIGQELRGGDRRAAPRLAVAAAAGFLVAAAATSVLAAAGLLRGPTVPGFPRPWMEPLVLAAVGAAVAVVPGLLRARRTPTAGPAWLGDHLLAHSDDVVMVEGNAYFPLSAIQPGMLVPTSTRSVCPWKGVASYFSVTVDGVEHPDVAWTYRRPSPLARGVKGRVAFCGDVEVRIERGPTGAAAGTGRLPQW